MSPQTKTIQKWSLVSAALADAWTDFILSRQALQASRNTLIFYQLTAGKFLSWVQDRGIGAPQEITARYVREYLAELAGRGKADSTVRDHARAIKTLVRFWYAEKYLPSPIEFATPKVADKRLPVLSAYELQTVVKAADNPRDRALVLFMVDSGLRRAETSDLNWGDVDFSSGLIRVRRGKGGKARSAVIGATARRALLAYRRTLGDTSDTAPVFQSRGGRMTGSATLQVFRRLSKQTGIHLTPHALRRTFVILSLRNEMDVLHLQALLGHASLAMTMHYAQMVDEDLLQAHRAHSPVDNLDRFRQK